MSDAKNTGSISISSQEMQQKFIESDAILVSNDFPSQINASTASTNCDTEFNTSSDNDDLISKDNNDFIKNRDINLRESLSKWAISFNIFAIVR